MRRLLAVAFLIVFTTLAHAQRRPPKLEPLPEPPPPPPMPIEEPAVIIQPEKGDKVEEVREGGRVVMLKVRGDFAPIFVREDICQRMGQH